MRNWQLVALLCKVLLGLHHLAGEGRRRVNRQSPNSNPLRDVRQATF